MKNKKLIFSFWEPKEKMPAYLKLCINTWRHFLTDYEIVILDYDSISLWLSESDIERFTCKSVSLPIQADIYRALLLQKYGGIWFDADTIIGSESVRDTIRNIQGEVAFLGKPESTEVHAAFLFAEKAHAYIIDKWVCELKKRVFFLRMRAFNIVGKIIHKMLILIGAAPRCGWNYAFNGIMDFLIPKVNKRNVVHILDKDKYGCFPERELTYPDPKKQYMDFWFSSGDIDNIDNIARGGIILLHNSWTPDKYRNMSESEFLSQDIRLAHFLRKFNR